MSVIARFSIPAEQFALGEALEVREGIRVRLESMIPTGTSTIPFLWVPSEDADAVQTALRGSPLVEDVRLVDETDAETLIRVDWSSEVDGLVDMIEESEAVILEAEGWVTTGRSGCVFPTVSISPSSIVRPSMRELLSISRR